MYKLIRAASLHDVPSGLLIPIYARDDRNAYFVHTADRQNQIAEFVPYYDFENYVMHLIDGHLSVDVGDSAPIVFRVSGKVVSIASLQMLGHWLGANKEALIDKPLLRSQLGMLAGKGLGELYVDWEKAASSIFHSKELAKIWISGETTLFQKFNSIWDDLDAPAVSEHKRSGKSELDYLALDRNELIAYLLNPDHYHDAGWDEVWTHAESRFGLDDVLFDAGYAWVSFIFANYQDELYEHHTILSRLIQYQYVRPGINQPFKDFLAEAFCEGLAEAAELGFPFHFHKMAIELAQDDMTVNEQLDFIAASLFFFSGDEYARPFFVARLCKLLDSVERDSFSRDPDEIIEIIEGAGKYREANPSLIARLVKKFKEL